MRDYVVIVCGGRTFGSLNLPPDAPQELIEERLEQRRFEKHTLTDMHAHLGPPARLFHGLAEGADTVASEWAAEMQITQQGVRAQWERFGRKAGIVRNKLMLDLLRARTDVDKVVVGFPGGVGTQHMLEIAALAGVKTYSVKMNEKVQW